MIARDELPEKRFQAVLVDGLERAGWTVMHVRRARVPTSRGPRWLTPTSQPGWPDLFAVKAGHLLAVEVKGPRTPVDAEQVAWLALFAEAPTGHGWVLRPRDPWETIGDWIVNPHRAPRLYGCDPTRLPVPPAEFLARAASARRAQRSRRGSTGAPPEPPPQGQLPIP